MGDAVLHAMPRKRYNKREAAKAAASDAPTPAPLIQSESPKTSPEPAHPWEHMFKPLARRGAVILVNVNGMDRQGFCATLTAFIILGSLLWQTWSLSTSPSFARFMTGVTAIAALLPLGFVVIRWLLRPKLLVALSHGGVVGLRVTGEAEWLPPDALREHGHQVNEAQDNSGRYHAIHTFGLGTRTLRVDGLFHNPLAARLDKPLERLFDDVWQHACMHWAATTRPGPPSTGLRHVVEPIFGLPSAFVRTPIRAFYSLPFRPIWLLWRLAQKSVDGVLSACFAWTLMRHRDHVPEGADWCPPRAPYHPPENDATDGSEPAMWPAQAVVRLTSHLLHVALAPGLAVAFAWLLFDITAAPSRDTVFLDASPGWGFRFSLGLGILLMIAGVGHLVGRRAQGLADHWAIGSLRTEWLLAQTAALLVALGAIWLANAGLSASKINTYFDRAPGAPIEGEIVATDSFIKEPSSFMTLDDWTPSWCSNPPESAHYPIGRTAPSGATLTVRWVKGTHRRTLGQQSQVVSYHPLPEEIPARLCGRHHVGALGLRYVDQLRGCDPT